MAYVSRHAKRDALLPFVRGRLLKAALQDLKVDPGVVGVYLTGSLAKENHDLFSDIDLHVIVEAGLKADFVALKRDRPTRWGEVLYYEDTDPKRPLIVVHYESFVKMDLWFHEPDDMKPSRWLVGSKILYDPAGIIERVVDESEGMTYAPSGEEIEMWRGKVFAYMHQTYRAAMRDELYDAMAMLDAFRWQIARGWYMEEGLAVDSGFGVWTKIDGPRSILDPWQSSLLRHWASHLSAEAIMKTMAGMVPEFMRLNKVLCNLTGLDEKRDWCERIIGMVL